MIFSPDGGTVGQFTRPWHDATDETNVWNEADVTNDPDEADEGAGALVAGRAG